MRSTRRTLGPLATVAVCGLLSAGCASAPSETAGGAGTRDTARGEAVRFARCMRDNGVRAFPDPDASGRMTIDGVLNGSSLDASAPAWKEAMSACKDLQPAGFTGHRRNAQQQEHALAFARCVRENGVQDFPDPTEEGPLIDTTRIPSAAGRGALDIPGFQAALDACREVSVGALDGQ
jgi:hypothetical protein